jgi:hypothetical protein
MAKMIVVFLTLFAAFFFGLSRLKNLKRRQRFRLLKLVAYSSACSLLTIVVLAAIVYFF